MIKNRRIIIVLSLFAITLLAYANSFFSDFVGDDVGRILTKENYYQQGLFAVLRGIMPDRPVLTFTIWLNYFFGGMNPFGYKLVNVLLHGACAAAVFEFLRDFFRRLQNPERLAFFAAAIFAVHPINNQAVMSVIQRGVLLATLLSLVSYLYLLKNIREAKTGHLYVAVGLFALAILSKPNVLMFPLIFVILLAKWEGLGFKRAFKKCLPFFLLFTVPLLQYLFVTRSQANAIPAFQYFLVQSKVIFFYFSKYLYPAGLQFIYPFDNFPADLLAFDDYRFLAAHAVFVLAALWAALQKNSLAAWLVILGYISLMPESGFFSILHVAFDHRNYIPLIFFAAAAVVGIARFKQSAYVLLPAVVGLGVLNVNYTAKINTYDKWVLYNLAANPENRSFYIYQLTQAVEAGNRERTEKILASIGSAALQDAEAARLKSFLDFAALSDPQKKEFINEALNFSLETQVSVHYFYFFEDFLRRELPRLYSPELAVFGLNSFYFGYLEYWQKYLRAPELFDRIRENLRQAVVATKEKTAVTEQIIGLRSEIALHRYFAEPLPKPVDFYLELLSAEFAGQPEAATLREWLKR